MSDAGIAGNKKVRKRSERQQGVHGIDTSHPVFQILLKPFAGQMKTVVVPKRDQKSRQNEENTYPDVKFAKETLDDVGKIFIKYVAEMGYKYKISCHCAHSCKRRNVIL